MGRLSSTVLRSTVRAGLRRATSALLAVMTTSTVLVVLPFVAVTAAPAAAATGCDANGDGVAGGTEAVWVTNGADQVAADLASKAGLTVGKVAAGYRQQVPVCVEDVAGTQAVSVTGPTQRVLAAASTAQQASAISAAWAELLNVKLVPPTPVMAPDASVMQVVGLQTWLSIDPAAWVPSTGVATVGEVTVTATATPSSTIWVFSDKVVRCDGPGVAYTPGATGPAPCGRDWEHTTSVAPMSVELFIDYDVTWTSSIGGSGQFNGLGNSGGSIDLTVGEIQSIGSLGIAQHPDDPGQIGLADEVSPGCTIAQLVKNGCGAPKKVPKTDGGGDNKCSVGLHLITNPFGSAEDCAKAAVDKAGEVVQAVGDGLAWVGKQLVDLYAILPGPLKAVVDVIKGCVEFGIDAVTGLWDMAKNLIAAGQDPVGFVKEQLELVKQLGAAIEQDPLGFAKEFLGDAIELDLLKSNPAEWVGKVGCEIAVAIFTAGQASGTGRIARLQAKLDDLKFWKPSKNPEITIPGHDPLPHEPGLPDEPTPGLGCRLSSFPTGTEVLLASGAHKPIDAIQPDDSVLAANPATGVWTPRLVLSRWSHLDQGRMATLTLAGDGHVTATDDHRFWVTDSGTWVEAGQLEPGDHLLTPDGVTTVAAVAISPITDTLVWELDIATDDTFAVHAGPTDVLVHNGDPFCDKPDPSKETDPSKAKALELEGTSGDAWAAEGKEVKYIDDTSKTPPTNAQGDTPPNPNKRPDQLVDGEFRDVYSPRDISADNAVQGALEKVADGQAQRVDIILDSSRSSLTPSQIREAFQTKFKDHLDQFAFTRPDGTVYSVKEITTLYNGQRVVIYP